MTTTTERPITATLATVMHTLNVSDSELGRRIDRKPQWVQARRSGGTPIRVQELVTMADAMGIPVSVLTMRRSDALRWIADQWDSGAITSSYAGQLDLGLAA